MAKKNNKRLPRGVAHLGLMASLAALYSNALAQSSVSLYGEIDASAL
jgi:hypothetical protein